MDLNWDLAANAPDREDYDGNLFDLAEDPHETTNLWSARAHAATVADLSEKVHAWVARCPPHARLVAGAAP